MAEKIDLAQQLERLGADDPLVKQAWLEALQAKRQKEHYVKYWTPNSPGQREVFQKFSPATKVFVVRGGNRSGKSDLGAAVTTAWGLGKDHFINEPAWEWVKSLPIPEPPSNIWVVGLDFAVIRDVLWSEKLRNGATHPPFLPKDESLITKVSDSEFWLQLANGSRITCKSADSGREKFQGASVDFIWIDEECDEEIFNECYQRTVDCKGKMLITLTPLADVSSGSRVPWVFDLYEDYKAGVTKDVEFVSLSVLDNPCVPEDEKERLQEKWAGHIEERARLYGEFVQRAGLVYPQWNPARHVVKRFQIPKSWLRVAVIDPAPTGMTACLWGAVEPETNNMFLYREYYESDLPVSEHAKSIILRSGGDLVDIWLIDPKAGAQKQADSHKSIAQLYKEAGLPVRLAEVGEDYGMAASIEYLNATTQAVSRHPKVFVFEDLKNFQWEITRYVWGFYGRGDLKGLSKEKPIKRHDHLMNAFQYLCAYRPRTRARVSLLTSQAQREFSKLNSYTVPN